MMKKFHIFRGSSTHEVGQLSTGLPAQFLRRLFMVLVLVLTLFGASQTKSAQANLDGMDFKFTLNVVSPRTTLCTGETVKYVVDAYAEVLPSGGITVKVPGVKIDAFPADKTVGAFIGADKTGGASGRMGSDPGNAASIVFKFKAASKPGSTKLYFDGAVKGFDIKKGYISFEVPIRVIACKYKVTTISKFAANPTYNDMIKDPPIKVKMKKAEMIADANGHFNGKGTLLWYGTSYTTTTPGVGSANAIEKFAGTSQAILNGDLYDNGELILNLTYEDEGMSTLSVNVGGVGQTRPGGFYQLDPLKISVDAAGGTVTQQHSYNKSSFMGTVTTIVTPVKVK